MAAVKNLSKKAIKKLERGFVRDAGQAYDMAVVEGAQRSAARMSSMYDEALTVNRRFDAEREAYRINGRMGDINAAFDDAHRSALRQNDMMHAVSQDDRLQAFRTRKANAQKRAVINNEVSAVSQIDDAKGVTYANARDQEIAQRRQAYQNLRNNRQTAINNAKSLEEQARLDEEVGSMNFADIDPSPSRSIPSAGPSVGPASAPSRTAADVMTERSFKGVKSQSDWTATRAHNETVAINRDMQRVLDIHQAGKMDDKLAGKLGFDNATDPRLSGDAGRQAIQDIYQGKLNNVKHNTTVRDRMGYNKVPQTAAAVGGTAWLVSKMSESKGQMSNSQLYGQSNPYGGM